jgi:hypothetical protein
VRFLQSLQLSLFLLTKSCRKGNIIVLQTRQSSSRRPSASGLFNPAMRTKLCQYRPLFFYDELIKVNNIMVNMHVTSSKQSEFPWNGAHVTIMLDDRSFQCNKTGINMQLWGAISRLTFPTSMCTQVPPQDHKSSDNTGNPFYMHHTPNPTAEHKVWSLDAITQLWLNYLVGAGLNMDHKRGHPIKS